VPRPAASCPHVPALGAAGGEGAAEAAEEEAPRDGEREDEVGRGANAVKEQRLEDGNEGLLAGRRCRRHRGRGGRGGHERLQRGAQ